MARVVLTDRDVSPSAERVDLTLADLATVRRGVATGANAFFLLSEETREALQLPSRAVSPVVRRLAWAGLDITASTLGDLPRHERRWLLTVDASLAQDSNVAAYLQLGVENSIDQRYLCADRETWYDVSHDLVVPDVIITAMSRGQLRIVTNSARAAITNNLYGWSWREGVSEATRTAVLTWLRSDDGQAALVAQSRQQGDGLVKLEPRALKNLRIPASVAQVATQPEAHHRTDVP